MEHLISVIVPVYNVEEYLDKCIKSILNQSYRNLEIILVNDGSPDNCPFICDEYARLDSRIKVIHKKNGGQADARNVGLERAKGEYISFIDSDDWIDLMFYEHLVRYLIDNKLDVVESGYIKVHNNHKMVHIVDSEKIYNKYEAMKVYLNHSGLSAIVCNKIYTRDVIGEIRFPLGKGTEDEFWTYQVIGRAEKIGYLAKPLYYYLQRESSTMGTFKINRLDVLEAILERSKYVKCWFSDLDFEGRFTLYRACVFHYQVLLEDKSIEERKQGYSIVRDYYKQVSFSISEIGRMQFIDKITYVLAKVNIHITSYLRNKLRLIEY